MVSSSYNFVEIDLAALAANYRAIGRVLGSGTEIMAVVKADAYGHGLVAAARAFAGAGARCFGVAEVEEGVALRRAGIVGEIVVLLGLGPEGVAEAVEHDLSPVIFSGDLLPQLSRLAVSRGKQIGVHLKLDCGMGRFGLETAAAGELAAEVAELPGLTLAGLLAHFPLADVETTAAICREQWAQFQAAAAALLAAGGGGERRPRLHMANSAALLRFAETRADLVRPGISLYGYSPLDAAWFPAGELPRLQPAMSLKSRVLQLKNLAAGRGISYGHRFITERPTRLAVVPLGYADGYPRGVSGKAVVLIGGRRVPLLGTICMNACMADVSDLSQVAVGDEVVFMGRQGEEFIGADEIAAWHGTISYELLCRMGAANRHLHR